jgi:hypothetical protein
LSGFLFRFYHLFMSFSCFLGSQCCFSFSSLDVFLNLLLFLKSFLLLCLSILKCSLSFCSFFLCSLNFGFSLCQCFESLGSDQLVFRLKFFHFFVMSLFLKS